MQIKISQEEGFLDPGIRDLIWELEEIRELKESQDSFYRRWMPETHQAIRELKLNVADSGFVNLRLFYDRLLDIETTKKTYARLYAESASEFERQIMLETLQAIVKEEKQVRSNIAGLLERENNPKKNNENSLTPDMVAQAKEYPLSNILGVGPGKSVALCIAHNERNPSMNIRRNFAYCHSCGFSGDSITVAEKVWGLSFVDAVKKLCLM